VGQGGRRPAWQRILAGGRAAGRAARWIARALDLARAGLATLWRAGEAALFADQDRWFLWVPALIALGIAGFFALPFEPSVPGVLVMGGIAAAGLLLVRRPKLFVVGLALACLGFGFTLAKLRTVWVAAPILPAASSNYKISGWIEDSSGRGRARVRLLVRVTAIDGLTPAQTPYRVRVSAPRSRVKAAAGDFVAVRANLAAPPAPVQPGAHDFGRTAWFARIGGTGYSIAVIEPSAAPGPRPAMIALSAWLEGLRATIGERIAGRLPGDSGALATALITGERGGVPKTAISALRDAGLAHLLAISGLHMVLMAGSLFWIVRALLAGVPALVLRRPIKKWSAGFALAAAFGYLLLSGAAVSTQRAFIMIAIMFIAILLDRPAITMRNVAIAALIVLCVTPESLLNVSFQMSFGTVIALIAVYETQRGRAIGPAARRDRHMVLAYGRLALIYLAGIALTTLIATAATAPIAAYHFNRVALYGLAGNLLALPIMGFVVMPAVGLSLLLMPLGLEALPLMVIGLGLDAVLAIAKTVSALPGAVKIVPTASTLAVVSFALGGVWLCLWRGRWRLIGAGVAALALAFCFSGIRIGGSPAVIVERDLKNVAVRGADGRLSLMSRRAGAYSAERWLRMDGDAASLKEAAGRGALTCDPLGCAGTMANGGRLAVITHAGIVAEECARAAVVISRIPLRKRCLGPKVIIDRAMLRRAGAHAVHVVGEDYRVETARARRGARPWSKVRARRPARAGRKQP